MDSATAWFVYVLHCGDGTLYTGVARDVAKRLEAHRAGRGAKYTRGRGPLSLLGSCQCSCHSHALRLERAIKALPRAHKASLQHPDALAAFVARLAPQAES